MTQQNKVTEQEVSRACELLKAAGIDPLSANRGQIRAIVGVGDRRARTIREWIHRGGMPTGNGSESHEVKGDQWTVSLNRTRICTLEQLIEHCKIDLTEWYIDTFKVNKWEVGMAQKANSIQLESKDGRKYVGWTRQETKAVVEPLYQVSATLRKKRSVVDAKHEIEALKELAKREAKEFPPVSRPAGKSGYMLELHIPDLHMGKLAWSKETGWENYDSTIARQTFETAVAKLLERTSSYVFDEIVLVVGNDLLHTDNLQNTTTAGTPQDVDGRYQRTFVITRTMIIDTIERLRYVAPVRVVMIPGNHDTLGTFHLGDSLTCYFHKAADVVIDNAPTYRKYLQFGKCMIMWTHGNAGKLQEYPLVMAVEQPQMWAETEYREVHSGDKHGLKTQELHGVRVRISPALCPPDNWHSKNFYVGNQRAAECFVWHKDEGLVGQATYTVPKQ